MIEPLAPTADHPNPHRHAESLLCTTAAPGTSSPAKQFVRGHHCDPGRGEFDCRWHAIIQAADRIDRRPVRIGQHELGVHCGRIKSVGDVVEAMELWAEHWNDDPKPFVWTKTAEDIMTKVRRGRGSLHQIKSATDH